MHEFGKFRLDLMSQSRHHTMSRTPVAVAPIVIGGPGSDFKVRLPVSFLLWFHCWVAGPQELPTDGVDNPCVVGIVE